MDRVLIVGVNFTPSHNSQHFDLAMEEMVSLVKACDMEPVGRIFIYFLSQLCRNLL